MTIWEKLLIGLITLAFIAAVVGSDKAAPTINALGDFLKGLIGNVVGTA